MSNYEQKIQLMQELQSKHNDLEKILDTIFDDMDNLKIREQDIHNDMYINKSKLISIVEQASPFLEPERAYQINAWYNSYTLDDQRFDSKMNYFKEKEDEMDRETKNL